MSPEKTDVYELFKEFGQGILLIESVDKGVFNETTGVYDNVHSVSHNVLGIVSTNLFRVFPSIMLNTNEKIVFVYADVYAPKITDKVSITSTNVLSTIKQIDEYKLKEELLAYRLVIDR